MEDVMEFHSNCSSLLKAVYLGRLRLTRLLLEGGAYINESNESGETPLMVACRTKHDDQLSADKAKMVKYLLESGADPNIQDKRGRTALMHACLERAGPEVTALLLKSGADSSLEDRAGCSALVHAVNGDDRETLRVLLEDCKARGKEVIIITTNTASAEGLAPKQHLDLPPALELEDGLCTSPSDIELSTLPQAAGIQPGRHAFTFADFQGAGTTASQPSSPIHRPGLPCGGLARLLHLQRLNSEPWLKIPASLLAEHGKAPHLPTELPDITPAEERSFRFNRAFPKVPAPHPQRTTVRERTLEQVSNIDERRGGERRGGGLCRNMSYDNLTASHSNTDLQNLGRPAPAPAPLPHLAVSSLRSIVQRRHIGTDHYSSDSQLSRYCPEDRGPLEKRRLGFGFSSALSSSRDSLESGGVGQRQALHPAPLSHTRSGCLPPLNLHTPVPHAKANSAVSSSSGGGTKGSTGPRGLLPSAPSCPRDLKAKEMLTRRHSMQTEKIKHLGSFEEIYSH